MTELDDDIVAMTEAEALELSKRIVAAMNATIKHTPHGYQVATYEKELFSVDNAKTMLSALRNQIGF